MIIVFGASGFIGNRLYKYYNAMQKPVTGTYLNNPQEGLVKFDFMHPDITELDIDLKKVQYAILCTAASRIDYCVQEEEKAYAVNVLGTKKIIDQLFQNNILPIFISSDHVFDGIKGYYSDMDKTSAVNNYGRHKVEIETYLFNSKQNYIVSRISKVYGLDPEDGTIISEFAKNLIEDKSILCATDNIFSPTYVEDIVRAIDILIVRNMRGIHNVVSPQAISRYDLAAKVKQRLKISTGKISPCLINDFDFLDMRPLNTSLDPTRFISATGYEFMKIDDAIDSYKSSISPVQ